jgi:hypothetical protein
MIDAIIYSLLVGTVVVVVYQLVNKPETHSLNDKSYACVGMLIIKDDIYWCDRETFHEGCCGNRRANAWWRRCVPNSSERPGRWTCGYLELAGENLNCATETHSDGRCTGVRRDVSWV